MKTTLILTNGINYTIYIDSYKIFTSDPINRIELNVTNKNLSNEDVNIMINKIDNLNNRNYIIMRTNKGSRILFN